MHSWKPKYLQQDVLQFCPLATAYGESSTTRADSNNNCLLILEFSDTNNIEQQKVNFYRLHVLYNTQHQILHSEWADEWPVYILWLWPCTNCDVSSSVADKSVRFTMRREKACVLYALCWNHYGHLWAVNKWHSAAQLIIGIVLKIANGIILEDGNLDYVGLFIN
jgi:hypothetical protein